VSGPDGRSELGTNRPAPGESGNLLVSGINGSDGTPCAVNIQLVCVRSLVVTLGHLLWIGSSGYWLVAVWVDGMVR